MVVVVVEEEVAVAVLEVVVPRVDLEVADLQVLEEVVDHPVREEALQVPLDHHLEVLDQDLDTAILVVVMVLRLDEVVIGP